MRGAIGLGVLVAASALSNAALAQVTPDSMAAGRQARKMDFQLQGQTEHDTNLVRTTRAHDTNLVRTTRALAASQGLMREDTIFTPTLNMDFLVPVGRQALFLRGSAGYLFHARNKRLDNDRYNVEAGVGNSIGPCGSTLSALYQRGRSELEDRTLVTTINNILEVKTVSAGVTCIRPPGLGVTATASKTWASNSAALVTSGDFETNSATLGVVYGRPRAGSLTVQGQYAKTNYTDRPAVALRTTDGYESIGGGVRFERKLGGRIQAVGGVSYTMVNVIESATPVPGALPVKDFNGLTYSAEGTFRASSRLQAQAKFERAIEPTLLTGSGYEVQTNYSARVEYRIGSRFTVAVGGEQQKSNIRGNVSPIGLILTDSKTRVASASLAYRQNERLTLTLTGHLEDRTANDPMFEYTSERIGASANVSF